MRSVNTSCVRPPPLVTGQFRHLQLAADPAAADAAAQRPRRAAVQVRRSAGQPQIVDLQWSHPVAGKKEKVPATKKGEGRRKGASHQRRKGASHQI